MPEGKRGGRGFAGMDEGRQREIARMGGRAAHEKGSAHEFSSEEARRAGRKGGLATSRDRDHMAAIGREGAEVRGEQRRARSNRSEPEEEGMEAAQSPVSRDVTAIEMLRQDHARVAALFEEFEGETDPAARRRIFEEIAAELEIHSRIEEQVFYPAVRTAQSQVGRELVEEAQEEHETVKQAIAELEEMEPTDPAYEMRVIELRENVEHHVLEEEGEMFEVAAQQISASRLQDLAAQMRSLKETLKPQVV